jgi:transcriptional regulator with XRE-family HTH domain
MTELSTCLAAMSNNDQGFFDALGQRIADLRKAQELTQAELGALLGVSQQTINSFEKGRRRVPASALPELSRILGVSVENLIGAEPGPAKRGPKPRLQQQLEELSRLPKPKQRFISEMIDTVLQQEGQRG